MIDGNISDKSIPKSPSQKRAAMGAIVAIYFSGFGWALGWNSIQYLINSEIYPIRLRALGGSIAMTFHFVNQYGNSKVRFFPAFSHSYACTDFCRLCR